MTFKIAEEIIIPPGTMTIHLRTFKIALDSKSVKYNT